MKASEEINEEEEPFDDEDDEVKDEISYLVEKITRKKKKGGTPKVDKKGKI